MLWIRRKRVSMQPNVAKFSWSMDPACCKASHRQRSSCLALSCSAMPLARLQTSSQSFGLPPFLSICLGGRPLKWKVLVVELLALPGPSSSPCGGGPARRSRHSVGASPSSSSASTPTATSFSWAAQTEALRCERGRVNFLN